MIRGKTVGMIEPVNGDAVAWNTMMDIAEAGLADPAQYAAIQQYLDVPNLIDYMLVHVYAGTYDDWPDRNWTAIRKREPGASFNFLSWDNGMSLRTSTWTTQPLGRTLQTALRIYTGDCAITRSSAWRLRTMCRAISSTAACSTLTPPTHSGTPPTPNATSLPLASRSAPKKSSARSSPNRPVGATEHRPALPLTGMTIGS